MQTLSLAMERALVAVDRAAARRVLEAAGPGVRPEEVVVPALERIGLRWESGEVSLSQVYMAGRIAEELLGLLAPAPDPDAAPPRVALAVLEDHHQLGKRMVRTALTTAGIAVADLGTVTVAEAVAAVRDGRFELLMLSALMLPSALLVREVVEGLRAADAPVPVVVGGAPFRLDPTLGARVGAQGWGASAADAVPLAQRFLGARR